LTNYTFPSHYPDNCPPLPHNEMCGIYYRLAINNNKSDPKHFRSYYEEKRRIKEEATEPCKRRALSIFGDYNDAVIILKQIPTLGKYIAHLDLTGGHGVVQKDGCGLESHHGWWVPNGVNPCDYCSKIEGPIS